ncbi:hypothetical protein P5673_025058 [Acropora cervicornis]|uniref:Uncharacterized protein n=1 Tax=Acropora cervicornis TaxID=6130 RepID=A0AAD9Q2J9_ACRCE|nr:hypothetical protein P5673_025058 [Acropora cervicornis]
MEAVKREGECASNQQTSISEFDKSSLEKAEGQGHWSNLSKVLTPSLLESIQPRTTLIFSRNL